MWNVEYLQSHAGESNYLVAYWCIAVVPFGVGLVAGIIDALIRAPGSVGAVNIPIQLIILCLSIKGRPPWTFTIIC